MTWQPTPELRWLECEKRVQITHEIVRVELDLKLQQKWIDHTIVGEAIAEEWRDVVTVKEDDDPHGRPHE